MATRVTSHKEAFSDIGSVNTGSINSKLIKEMISKLSIVDVLSDLYGLSFDQHTDTRFRGHCPFPDHRDSSPSFDVWDDTGRYKCWGCGRSGDILEFFKIIDGISFKEALLKLSALSGVNVGSYDSEAARAIYEIGALVNNYIEDLYCQTDLPGGIPETEFLRHMVARIKAYEIKVNYDTEELAWVDLVYELLDAYDEDSNYKEMTNMWEQIGKKMKARYAKYLERQAEIGDNLCV